MHHILKDDTLKGLPIN